MSVSSLRSFEYLETLQGSTFRKLYKQPSTALAIFRRMLPHLAKSFVMAMLYVTQPLTVAELESWVKPESKRQVSEKTQTLLLLSRLHMVTSFSEPGDPPALALTQNFAASLRLALTGGGDHQSFGVPCDTPDSHQVDIEFLDDFCRFQWEGILHYVVGSAGVGQRDAIVEPSDNVKQLLISGGLMQRAGGVTSITETGFSFLLQEVNAQVWTLLILFLERSADLDLYEVEALSFLFTLGSLELGQDYSTATLTNTQLSMLSHLKDFGIVYQRKTTSDRFYPTRLATTLTSDAGALRGASFQNSLQASDGKGFILVETNYRIYAYTSSTLQIAVLELFAKLYMRFPNMVSARITRDSIQGAIKRGITSDQIISYLTTHAHPQMRKQMPILPPTVVDQIRLWQIENERMKTTTGFLFQDFASYAAYDSAVKYAEEIGVLVWHLNSKQKFFATDLRQLKEFLNKKPSSIDQHKERRHAP